MVKLLVEPGGASNKYQRWTLRWPSWANDYIHHVELGIAQGFISKPVWGEPLKTWLTRKSRKLSSGADEFCGRAPSTSTSSRHSDFLGGTGTQFQLLWRRRTRRRFAPTAKCSSIRYAGTVMTWRPSWRASTSTILIPFLPTISPTTIRKSRCSLVYSSEITRTQTSSHPPRSKISPRTSKPWSSSKL